MRNDHFKIALQEAVTKAASYSATSLELPSLSRSRILIVTLDITSAERDTGNETYDFYITTGDGVSSWDLIHFPQIATTGAKRYTARIVRDVQPANVTTATPGVAAVDSATLATVSGGTHAIKSLGAGIVRNGPWGDLLGYELVVAGTVVTGIAYSITVTAAG